MKNLILALMAVVLITGVNYGSINPEKKMLTVTENQAQVCITVSLIIISVTYCYTYRNPNPLVENQEIINLLKSNEDAEGEIIKSGSSSILVINGFNDDLDGIVVNGGTYNMPNNFVTIPGDYTINDGKLKVPLKKK